MEYRCWSRLSGFDGICAELKYRVKRHAQYYLNDRPCVERDEHYYEREEDTSYKH